jgi:hypothetical protein
MYAALNTTRSLERIGEIGLSRKERTAVIKILHERQTHREAASAEGVTRAAYKQRMRRARQRARLAGITIPKPRRGYQTVTLAELAARN